MGPAKAIFGPADSVVMRALRYAYGLQLNGLTHQRIRIYRAESGGTDIFVHISAVETVRSDRFWRTIQKVVVRDVRGARRASDGDGTGTAVKKPDFARGGAGQGFSGGYSAFKTGCGLAASPFGPARRIAGAAGVDSGGPWPFSARGATSSADSWWPCSRSRSRSRRKDRDR